MIQLLISVVLVASCSARPQMFQTVSGDLMYLRGDIPAVVKIPEPGIKFTTSMHASSPAIVTVQQPTILNIDSAHVLPVVKSAEFVAPAIPQVASVDNPVVKNVAVIDTAVAPVLPDVSVAVVQTVPETTVIKSATVVAPDTHVAVASFAPQIQKVAAVAVPPRPLDAPEPPMPSMNDPHVGGQFRSQDERGQYTFGHYGGPNTRVETRDSLGRTSGSFAYVDPEGDVQVRKYSAAPGSGFRVAASDLVEDTPEVAQAKSAFNRARTAVKAMQQDATVVTTL